MNKKPLRLWSCFWGEKHLDLFEKALVRSLSWPLNKDAISHAKWDIWTKEAEFGLIADVAKSVGISLELNAIDSFLEDLPGKYLNDAGVMMNKMFCHSAKRCLDSGSQMLIAPPDTIFGGDSLANIIQAGEQPNTVVFVVHIRVLPEILDSFPVSMSLSNGKLVTLAMEYVHSSFKEAQDGLERINSFIGGIFWKKRPNGVYSVQHRLPTPYLINWTEADYNFFSKENPPGEWPQVFGMLDHIWPSVTVFPRERARILGSSDDAFIVEITDKEKNTVPLMTYELDEADRFWRNVAHNQILRQFVVTLRPE